MENWFNKDILEIVWLTLKMAFFSTLISSVLGIFLGLILERANFPGKKIILRINRTLMGTPPVVMGLIVYLLLMRKGVLGFLNILFTLQAMIFAQVLIITPIISGMICESAQHKGPKIRAFATTMGADFWQSNRLVIRELKSEIYFAVVSGFSRSISEVGAVMIVGGNILHKTRTMTTAITLLRNKGNYNDAIVLGAILLILSFIIQTVLDWILKKEELNENI